MKNTGTRLSLLTVAIAFWLATCTNHASTTADTFTTERLEGYSGFPAPAVSPSPLGTSTPGEAERPPAYTRIPLKVMFKSPVGKAPATQWAVVTFNQPMNALGVLPTAPPTATPLTFSPAAPYTWRWVSGDTLRAEFTKRLANATRFSVTLGTALPSLGGTRLEKPVSWTFETPRPRIMGIYATSDHAYHLRELYPDNGFILSFDQRISPKGVQAFVRVKENGRPVDFSLSSWTYATQLRLTPARPFAERAKVTIEVIGGYTGQEGPLPGHKSYSRSFTVYGDLTGSISTERLGANKKLNPFHHALTLTFTGAVLESEILKHLTITPAIRKFRDRFRSSGGCSPNSRRFPATRNSYCGYSFSIDDALAPGTRYTVRVKKGMPGLNGKRLDKELRLTFTTDDYPSGLFLPIDQEGTLPKGRAYPYKHTNIRSLRVAEHPIKASEIGAFLRCLRDFQEHDYISPYRRDPSDATVVKGKSSHYFKCIKSTATRRRTLGATSPRNRIGKGSLRFGTGARVVSFTSPQIVDGNRRPVIFQRFIHVTDLGVHTRVHPYGIIAWVTDFSTGRPIKGAKISVFDDKGKALVSGKTGADGVWEHASRTPLTRDRRWSSDILVIAERGRDFAFTTGESSRYVGENPSGDRGDLDEDETPGYDDARYSWLYDDLSQDLDSGSTNWSLAPVTTGYISLERGIYRPGQLVHLHGAARIYHLHRSRPAAGKRYAVRITDSNRQVLGTFAITTDAMGVFTTTFPLPRGAKLGNYHVTLLDGNRRLAGNSMQVKMYREPRFEVFFTTAKDEYLPDEHAELTVRGKYLFGGNMGKATYRLNILGRDTYISFTGKNLGFVAGRYANHHWYRRKWYHTTGALGETGLRRISVPLAGYSSSAQVWPVSHLAEVEVNSSAQRAVAASTSFIQHPANIYVAFRSLDDKDQRTQKRLRLLTPLGKSIGPRSVKVSFYAARYHSSYSSNPLLSGLGRRRYSSGWYPVGLPLWSKNITIPAEGYTLTFGWPPVHADFRRADIYRGILLYEVTDEKGRVAKTSDLVSRPARHTEPVKAQAEARHYLRVETDKLDYKVGETAVITVKTRGVLREAVLFVERERIFHTQRLKFNASGIATVRVKVLPEFLRSVTVRVVGLVADPKLRRKVPYVVATSDITLNDSANRLSVGITTDKTTYAPREKVNVRLQVKDFNGHAHKAHVVIMAVDEAVLRLTGYALPNPYNALEHNPMVLVKADDVRKHLLRLHVPVVHYDWLRNYFTEIGEMAVGGSGFAYGLGGRGGSAMGSFRVKYMRGSSLNGHGKRRPQKKGVDRPKARNRFLTTAWHATVITDETGKATTAFTLPDNLTRYRIMAFAVAANRAAGLGRSQVTVARDLITLPSLPRFMREGDLSTTGITLYWAGDKPVKATVRLALTGRALTLSGPAATTLTLKPGVEQRADFTLRAGSEGTARLRFDIEAGGLRDALEMELPVQRVLTPEVVSVAGETTTAVRQRLLSLKGVQRRYGGMELTLSSTALSGVEDGLEQLVQYPYGCMEQKTSKLLPMIALMTMGDRFKLKLPGKLTTYVNAGLMDILAMQHPSGGFSYWPSTSSSPGVWTTAYALIVFARLKEAKVRVPPQSVARAIGYLRRYLGGDDRRGYYHFSRRALALFALSLHGIRDTREALKLFAVREYRPLFARSMLLMALATDKQTKPVSKAVQTLTDEVGSHLSIDGDYAHAVEHLGWDYQALMHSDDRSTAIILMALSRIAPKHPMISRMVRYFLKGRKNARFRNTQEAAWSLMAMMDYAKFVEKEVPDFSAGVWLGTRRIATARFTGRDLTQRMTALTMDTLLSGQRATARDLVFAKKGAGRLYYGARLRYARSEPPSVALDRGFTVSRKVSVLHSDGTLDSNKSRPAVGETVLVQVTVKSTVPRKFVVIDDPLPAGMEAIDADLRTTGKTFGARNFHSDSVDHRELRDDRVVHFVDSMRAGTWTFSYLARVTSAGNFISPPTRVEEMYNPEVFGYTPTKWFNYAR